MDDEVRSYGSPDVRRIFPPQPVGTKPLYSLFLSLPKETQADASGIVVGFDLAGVYTQLSWGNN